jgi:hypothetical protein
LGVYGILDNGVGRKADTFPPEFRQTFNLGLGGAHNTVAAVGQTGYPGIEAAGGKKGRRQKVRDRPVNTSRLKSRIPFLGIREYDKFHPYPFPVKKTLVPGDH